MIEQNEILIDSGSDHSERNFSGQISGNAIDRVNVECYSKLETVEQRHDDFQFSGKK